jgi:replicative DNA helicase
VGKTAFALHLALAAGRAGKHVLVNSLEMQGERLGDRWLCAQAANVDAGHLKTGLLDAGERQQALEAARLLSALPVYVDDNPKMSMDHIRSSALLQKSKGRCDLLIIDYLQLCEMKSGQKNRNREQEVAEASRKAKLIAKELDIPVILLCQLNRECEMRADKRPALSDLRESGAIEQDADVVMLLYRPALYGLTSERRSKFPSEGLGMVILAKHRNGETGDVYFGHNPAMTKIGEYVPPTEWMMRNAK